MKAAISQHLKTVVPHVVTPILERAASCLRARAVEAEAAEKKLAGEFRVAHGDSAIAGALRQCADQLDDLAEKSRLGQISETPRRLLGYCYHS